MTTNKDEPMNEDRIHTAISDDGTEIVGSVHGEGPPLVLVHGALGTGELHWSPSLPFLTNRFTCYLPSTRNRGLSGHSEDLTPEHHVQDVTAFAASIGEPVGLVGLSMGGTLVLGAAARLESVTAVAAYEPAVLEVMGGDDYQRFVDAVTRMGEEAAEGRLAEGARAFLELVCNETEMAALTPEFLEAAGENVPTDLAINEQGMDYEGPRATDAEVLARITAPVLLLHGRRSNMHTWFLDGVNHTVEHVSDAREHEFPQLGHAGPIVRPEPVFGQLNRFFATVTEPA